MKRETMNSDGIGALHQSLFENMTVGVVYHDADGKILSANNAAQKILGLTLKQLQGLTSLDPSWRAIHEDGSDFPGNEHPSMVALYTATPVSDVTMGVFNSKDQEYSWIRVDAFPQFSDQSKTPTGVISTFESIDRQKEAEDKSSSTESTLKLFVEYAPAAIAMFDTQMRYIAASRRYLLDYRLGEINVIGRSHYDIFPEISEEIKNIHRRCLEGAIKKADADPFPREDGTLDWVRWEVHPWYQKEEIGGIILFSEVITNEINILEENRSTRAILQAALSSMSDAVYITAAKGKFTEFNESFAKFYKFKDKLECAKTFLPNPRVVNLYLPNGDLAPLSEWPEARALQGEAGNSVEYSLRRNDTGDTWIGSFSYSPIRDDNGIITGSVVVGRDITDRKTAEEEIRNQVRRLSSLRTIDMAISSSLDLHVTLNVILEQVVNQLNVDAAVILLYEPLSNELVYSASRGFITTGISQLRLKLGEDFGGQAALNRRTVSVMNLDRAGRSLSKGTLLAEENFVSLYAVPLLAKGKVNGVLEIFHRTPLNPKPDWLDYLETLAGQAAIAIDSGQLFDGLQRTNNDLLLAYDATIVGWSHAMDLRDKETEGHTERVTDTTIDLARIAGMTGDQIANIRRGALLHDIGKLGVPDNILFKPDKLDDDEWTIMRKHPQFAHDLLSPIEFLKPALDIPYCHHERWDGTGYPRGLIGDEIPFEARLFAVVDVWDALCSNRPYRAGWPESKVLNHIHNQSGTHFDPRAVDLFMRIKNYKS
jgi:PAS domain S-box-containing protein